MQAIPKGELLVAIEQEEREADEDMTEQPPEFDLTSSGHLSVNVRNTFVAPPGFSLLAVDYSQIEMRTEANNNRRGCCAALTQSPFPTVGCLAHVTRDANLVKFFQSDTDIHKLVGSRCFGKPIEEISKKEREYAKVCSYIRKRMCWLMQLLMGCC
jgi:DNA polymerase-1